MRITATCAKCRQAGAVAASAGGVENSRREGDALLGLFHAVGRPDGDPPLIHSAGRPGPIFRSPRLVALADARDLGGVFDDDLVGTDEIGEDIVSGPVPSDAPFDGEAALAQPPGA